MRPSRLLSLPILACAAAVAADRLLWDAPLGLGAACLAAGATTLVLLRGQAPATAWICAFLATALLGIDPGPLAALLALLALAVAALAARGWRPHAPDEAAAGALRSLPRAIGRGFRDLALIRRLRGPRTRRLAAWTVPLLGAGIFLVIFAIANPVISARIGALFDWFFDLDLPLPSRVLLWWAAGSGLWLLARARVRARRQPEAAAAREPAADWTVRCLAAFNLAFLLQNGCDAMYLWSGSQLPEGMTYAAYAHRGAYPLVLAALLAGAFVLLTVRPGGAAERSRPARILVIAFLAQTVLLTASAWWRLDLYIDAYGLTRWRLASLAWMGLVGFGLATIAWRIATRDATRRLVSINAWACAIVLLGFALGDGDGLIAERNVERALGPHPLPLDLDYCQELGPAALPALARYAAATRDRDAVCAVDGLRGQLYKDLDDWRGWTLRRWLVRAELAAAGRRFPARAAAE